jgi:Pyruvate/2-oxoacid:ferredoxin oxidoreductase gamma subunit
MVAVGALLASAIPVLSVKDLEATLNAHMPGRHKHLLPKNMEALKRGEEYAKKELAKVAA